MRELVERDTGVPCLFLQGASGELGPREGFVGDTVVADRNGRELGYAALSALTALPAAGTTFDYAGPIVSGATLGSWKHQRIDLVEKAVWKLQRWHEPLRYRPGQPTIEQTQTELDQFQADEATARAAGDETRAADSRAMAERKTRLLHRLHKLPPGETYPLQVVFWHLGDAIWLGVQGESSLPPPNRTPPPLPRQNHPRLDHRRRLGHQLSPTPRALRHRHLPRNHRRRRCGEFGAVDRGGG
jgi:hypothetical protein